MLWMVQTAIVEFAERASLVFLWYLPCLYTLVALYWAACWYHFRTSDPPPALRALQARSGGLLLVFASCTAIAWIAAVGQTLTRRPGLSPLLVASWQAGAAVGIGVFTAAAVRREGIVLSNLPTPLFYGKAPARRALARYTRSLHRPRPRRRAEWMTKPALCLVAFAWIACAAVAVTKTQEVKAWRAAAAACPAYDESYRAPRESDSRSYEHEYAAIDWITQSVSLALVGIGLCWLVAAALLRRNRPSRVPPAVATASYRAAIVFLSFAVLAMVLCALPERGDREWWTDPAVPWTVLWVLGFFVLVNAFVPAGIALVHPFRILRPADVRHITKRLLRWGARSREGFVGQLSCLVAMASFLSVCSLVNTQATAAWALRDATMEMYRYQGAADAEAAAEAGGTEPIAPGEKLPGTRAMIEAVFGGSGESGAPRSSFQEAYDLYRPHWLSEREAHAIVRTAYDSAYRKHAPGSTARSQ